MKRSWQSRLVLIGCAESSGSTLFSHALDRHSLIASGREFWLFCHQAIYSDFERCQHLPALAILTGISGRPLHERRRFCRRPHSFGLRRRDLVRWLSEANDVEAFAQRVHHSITNYAGRPVWVEKSPPNIRLVRQILDTFTEARFIHIVRDPRDVVLSLAHKREQSDLLPAAAHWLTSVSAIQPVRAHPRIMEVSYEGLCERPHETMERVFDFLDLPNEDVFHPDAKPSRLGKGRKNTSWSVAPGDAISTKSIGRYSRVAVDWSFLNSVRLTSHGQQVLGTEDFSAGSLARSYGFNVPDLPDVRDTERLISERKLRNELVAPLMWMQNTKAYVDLVHYTSNQTARLNYGPRRRQQLSTRALPVPKDGTAP